MWWFWGVCIGGVFYLHGVLLACVQRQGGGGYLSLHGVLWACEVGGSGFFLHGMILA